MSSADQIQIVLLQEYAHDVLAENKWDSSIIFFPTLSVFFWIWPKKITEQACVWHVCRSHDSSDLLHIWEFWGKSSMHAENLFIYNSCHRKAVKAICECLPEFDIISSLTLIIKPVDSIDRSALMVSSQQEKVLWVFDLISEKKTNCF